MNEFWTSLTATIVGGVIASLSAIAAITYGKKLDRTDHPSHSVLAEVLNERRRCGKRLRDRFDL